MTLMFVALMACGNSASQAPVQALAPAADMPATPAPKSTSSAPVHDPVKVAEALKLADLADGTEDKIAHKCAGCALSMDGDPAHTLDVNGTTLHLCASMCKEHFSKDPEGSLLQLLN